MATRASTNAVGFIRIVNLHFRAAIRELYADTGKSVEILVRCR